MKILRFKIAYILIYLIGFATTYAQTNEVQVSSLSNFPDPNDEGEITLNPNSAYSIHGMVNIGDNYINLNGASLLGTDPGKDGIVSTVKGAVLRSKDVMVYMDKIAVVTAGKNTVAYEFVDETRAKFCNLFEGCSVLDGHQGSKNGVGMIKGFNTTCIDLNYWNIENGLKVSGRSNKFTGVLNYITGIANENSAIEFLDDVNIEDIVLSGNYFVYTGGSAIKVNNGAKVNQSKLSLNLFQGQSTIFEGFDSYSPGWEMIGNGVQVPDSKAKAIIYMNDNTVETEFLNPELFQPISGAFSPIVSHRFSIEGTKLKFIGKKEVSFDVLANVAGICGYQNGSYSIAIRKNGSELIVPKSSVGGLNKGSGFTLRLDSQVDMKEGDYLELVIKSNGNSENRPVVISDVTLKVDQF